MNAAYSLRTYCSYQNSKWVKTGNHPKKQCSFGNWEALERKVVFKGLEKEGAVMVSETIRFRTGDQWPAVLNATLNV
jgi:hypothetical protein